MLRATFDREQCDRCGLEFDIAEISCPHCKLMSDEEAKEYGNRIRLNPDQQFSAIVKVSLGVLGVVSLLVLVYLYYEN